MRWVTSGHVGSFSWEYEDRGCTTVTLCFWGLAGFPWVTRCLAGLSTPRNAGGELSSEERLWVHLGRFVFGLQRLWG